MSWLTENICAVIEDLMNGIMSAYGSYINNIFYTFVAAGTTNAYYQNAVKVFLLLGLALVSLVSAKIVTSGYMFETAYDSDEDPFNLLIRIAEATAVMSCSGGIFSYALKFSKDLCTDLLGVTETNGFIEHTDAMLGALDAVSNTSVVIIITIAIMLVTFIIFAVMSGLRAGELLAMNLFLPIFAVDLLTNSRERWGNFFFGYIFAFVSYTVQTLFFMIAVKSYITANYTNPGYLLSAFIWMIVAIRAPKFIEKYLYTTGVSNAASSGMRMVAQTMIIRRAM